MAKKATQAVAIDAPITDEEIKEKIAASFGGLSREQAVEVIKNQREHDAALGAGTTAAE